MMNRMFGAPSRARLGAGHAGWDTSNVRPITPGKARPDLYSLSAMGGSLLSPIALRGAENVSSDRGWHACRLAVLAAASDGLRFRHGVERQKPSAPDQAMANAASGRIPYRLRQSIGQ